MIATGARAAWRSASRGGGAAFRSATYHAGFRDLVRRPYQSNTSQQSGERRAHRHTSDGSPVASDRGDDAHRIMREGTALLKVAREVAVVLRSGSAIVDPEIVAVAQGDAE